MPQILLVFFFRLAFSRFRFENRTRHQKRIPILLTLAAFSSIAAATAENPEQNVSPPRSAKPLFTAENLRFRSHYDYSEPVDGRIYVPGRGRTFRCKNFYANTFTRPCAQTQKQPIERSRSGHDQVNAFLNGESDQLNGFDLVPDF